MPARPYVLAIIAFWLASSGWLFHKEVWPRLRSGEPPPYTIDLADEARQHNIVPIRWAIHRNGVKIGIAKTTVRFHESDDTFELRGEIESINLGAASIVQIREMMGKYRITRDGNLRELEVNLTAAFTIPGQVPFTAKGRLEGQVKDEKFFPRCRIDSALFSKEFVLDPVPISSSGNVLNPLHPVNRINGLSPGQRWRTPLVDPLRDLPATIFGTSPGVRMLNAEVLPELQLHWWNGRDRECYVIEYMGEDIVAHVWVREKDGMVLRHDTTIRGEEMVLERQ